MKNSELAENITKKLRSAIDEHDMLENAHGVLVGFSGGADSSALLRLMKTECDRRGLFLKAVHVNHGIRGDEAERDAHFCSEICETLGIEFELVKADIPELARLSGRGVEETARDFRYSCFSKLLTDDPRLDIAATAHNADDNAETLLFNLIRGSGIGGLSGIPPVRELGEYRVIRPLILVSKEDILDFCRENSIAFVHDSTNDDTAYTRNYIRHELIPGIKRLNPSFLTSAARLSSLAREDDEYIRDAADELVREFMLDPSAKRIAEAHSAVASRALTQLYSEISDSMLESVHIRSIISLCRVGRGEAALPDRVYARIESGKLCFTRDMKKDAVEFSFELHPGINRFEKPDFAVLLTIDGKNTEQNEKDNEKLKKIYNLSMQIRLNSDTINHMLFVRSRRSGDSYVYGKMTRRLKKLYNDRGFDEKKRRSLPIFCDGDGIIWIPGFPCADRARPIESTPKSNEHKNENIGDSTVSLIYYYNEV